MTDAPGIDWRRNQAAVTGAAFIGFTGFTLVMPFLPLYLEELGVEDPGAIAIWSGVSLGVTPAVTAVMAPVWARVAQRVGRKPMVARSLLSFVVIMAATAYVTAAWHVFALRALQGLFAGYGPIVMTMAAESAPPGKVASAIGSVQTAQRLGPALGPVIGGTLAQSVGLRNAFLVAALFYLAAAVLVLVGYREPARRPRTDAVPGAATMTFSAFCRVPNFVLFMALIFGLQMVDRSFGPILPLYLRNVATDEAQVPLLSGVVFTAAATAAALGNQTSSWWLRRVPIERLMPWTAGLAAVAALVFGAAPSSSFLVLAAMAFGLGIGIATTSVYTAASLAVAPQVRGLAFGYLTTAYLVAIALSPVVAGLIGSRSVRAVFVADALALGLVAWAGWRLMKPHTPQSGHADAAR